MAETPGRNAGEPFTPLRVVVPALKELDAVVRDEVHEAMLLGQTA